MSELSPARIELLLYESYSLRYRDPERMIEYADLACQAAESMKDDILGAAATANLRARTWAELGNAYRVADHMLAAEESLEQAISWARRGSKDLKLAARISDFTASLFSDQGRFNEACEIMQALCEGYEELGDMHLAGRALISEGIFAGHAGRPKEGAALICAGMSYVDLEREPKLKAVALHGLAFNLIEAEQYRRARPLLWHIRASFRQDEEHLNLLRLRWLEGKICSGLGDLQGAEQHFQEVRAGFKKAGQRYDAALVALDLALLWTQQGRREDARLLAQELIYSFRAQRIARETIAGLLVFRHWTSCSWVPDEVLIDQLKTSKTLLQELERQPKKPRKS